MADKARVFNDTTGTAMLSLIHATNSNDLMGLGTRSAFVTHGNRNVRLLNLRPHLVTPMLPLRE